MSCLCVSCNRAHLCHQVRGLIFDNVTGCFKDSNDRALPKRVPSAARNYALMTTCTNLAVQDKSAGLCIEANAECQMPNPGSDSQSFWKAASSKGQSTNACDPTYPNGHDWTMVRQTDGVEDELYPSHPHAVLLTCLCVFAHLCSVRFQFFVRVRVQVTTILHRRVMSFRSRDKRGSRILQRLRHMRACGLSCQYCLFQITPGR